MSNNTEWVKVHKTESPKKWTDLGNARWVNLIYNTRWNAITFWRRYRGVDY